MYRRLLGLAVAGLCVLGLASCQIPEEGSAMSAINADRGVNGQGPLGANLDLTAKAQAWAGYLAVNSGNSCSMATLSHSALSNGAPAGWRKLGENVGCSIRSGDLESFVAPLQTGFMNSPGHRANILDPAYNYGGVGMALINLPNGQTLVYEVQEFAAV
jgi:uncharacterized protein YkwD